MRKKLTEKNKQFQGPVEQLTEGLTFILKSPAGEERAQLKMYSKK